MQAINIFVISLIVYLSSSTTTEKKKLKEPMSVTVSKWEYCEGCKETVNLYTRSLSNRLETMHKTGVQPNSELTAQDLIDGICDSEDLQKFQNFVKYSCIKILNSNETYFLEQFQGISSTATVLQKALVFERKKNICTKINACSEAIFQPQEFPPSVSKSTKKCRACELVASEIDTAYRMLKPATPKGDMKPLRSFLEDKFCNSLGYSHQPYSWLEPTCDEMVDDHLDNIADVMKFHQKVAGTGFTPSQSMPQMLCEELYACGKEKAKDVKKGGSNPSSKIRSKDRDL